jgi:hypothetical protein
MIQTTIWFKNRSFKSFNELQKEGCYEQFYGGIHYRAAIENGIVQGKEIGICS